MTIAGSSLSNPAFRLSRSWPKRTSLISKTSDDEILSHHSHLLRQRRAAHRDRLLHICRRSRQTFQENGIVRSGGANYGIRRTQPQCGKGRQSRQSRSGSVLHTHGGRIHGSLEKLGIDYDHFIRTSNPRHHETVRWLFERCKANGYIYKGGYTGQYCVNDELYINDAKPGDPCPECGRATETVTEENYFFKLSAFQQRLLDLYQKDPNFVKPDHRRNEIIAFVQQGLNDLSITRTNIQWGIPAPVDGHHVFYVWFDALISYMSAVKNDDLWPADLHLIGKDILRFHAVYWPAFLMAADLPLPKKVFAHGWILFEENKMSKSRGNVVKPGPIAEVTGVDALRYFLLREITFGQDGSFSYDALIQRYNSDLANGLGNLASRTLSMIQQYRQGAVPESDGAGEIAEAARKATEQALEAFDDFNFSKALEIVWAFISVIDKFIVERAPW